MKNYSDKLFMNERFMPHGNDYLWRPDILWTHIISDIVIACSYFAIPVCLLLIYRQKRELQLKWILALCIFFVISCGATHILSIVTVWNPVYRLEGYVKAIMALASAGTVFMLLKSMPAILGLPTRHKWEEANKILQQQIRKMKEKDEELLMQLQVLEEQAETIKQSKEALQQSEERYQSVMEVFDSVIIQRDDEIIFINPAGIQLLGAKRANEIIGKRMLDFVHPASREIVTYRRAQLDAGNKMPMTELKFKRLDGKEIDVELASVPLMLDGKIAYQAILRDITSRKESEKRLKENETKFRQLFELDMIGIFYWDADGNISEANHTFFNMTGYNREQMQQGLLKWNEICAPEYIEKDQKALSEVLQTGLIKGYEKEIIRKDGTRFPSLTGGALLEDSQDKGVAYMIDISERKQNEQQIHESQRNFRRLFESDMIGIMFWHFDGRLMDANDAFLQTVGYTREDLVNQNIHWRSMTPAKYHQRDQEAGEELLKSGVHTPYEKEYIRKNGTTVPILVGGALFEGKTDRGVSFIVDITERKKADEILKKTLDELKKRNHELDNYVYKVSHDLRSPLASILGLINVIKLEKDAEIVAKYFEMIENRANKLDHFIQSILSHSRTLNNEVKLEKIDFDKLIAESFEELKYMANWDKVQLIVDKNQQTDFYSDQLRINILLKNFTSNAIKYFDPATDCSYLKYSIDITVEQAVIRISDNGLGIDANYLPKIFDMFFRATEKSDGSGLGLYIVKQAIETLGGTIGVDSKAGKGTTFTIMLPNKELAVG